MAYVQLLVVLNQIKITQFKPQPFERTAPGIDFAYAGCLNMSDIDEDMIVFVNCLSNIRFLCGVGKWQ